MSAGICTEQKLTNKLRVTKSSRAALASVEAGSWGGDGALRDAKESVKDCRAEVRLKPGNT